ncbi:hypothetical protein E2C01_013726 [Portunus trituberculatus]|uniref:Uncharacterized protein n=1 Tax=Portunus trituberculatus TaxID=210409 RepID=A0A5B7DHD8_PORTR|nr:hypothetical protein [Portunus trituberculatus]
MAGELLPHTLIVLQRIEQNRKVFIFCPAGGGHHQCWPVLTLGNSAVGVPLSEDSLVWRVAGEARYWDAFFTLRFVYD